MSEISKHDYFLFPSINSQQQTAFLTDSNTSWSFVPNINFIFNNILTNVY
uniref:Uncharacterized protein n=1 Tax=Ciona intestinalis TaxID=7719 RepID=H2XUC5_CIOIN